MGIIVEIVEIVEVVNLANSNIFCQFMHVYLCLFASPRPNTLIKFRFTNTSKSLLTNSPSPLKSTT